MVWAVAVGMLLLVIWRVLEAVFGHRDAEGADRVRKRLASALKACIYAALGVTAVRVATGSGSGKGSQGMTARLMDLPGGQWIVVLDRPRDHRLRRILVWRGWTEKFAEHLETEGKLGYSGAAYLLFGQVGYIAKGIALALVGGLFCYAGATHEPDRSPAAWTSRCRRSSSSRSVPTC